MSYEVKLNLPADWSQETSSIVDENGNEAVHIEAINASSTIDIFIGELPEDTTPEDQAFSNYADMVGFDDDGLDSDSARAEDDSEEGESPIVQIIFNGKNAWGFEAFSEDNSVVAVLTQEIKSGVLAVINVNAPDDHSVQKLLQLVEKGLRVKKS